MLPEERKRVIVETVEDEGGCTVSELSERLDVSEATIRRDLASLADEGLVERSHGGAVPADSVAMEPSYGLKDVRNSEAKRAIGRRAAHEINDGHVVCFDAGTTAIQVARAVPNDTSIIAATNSPVTARELGERFDEVKLTGGTLRKQTWACVGPTAEAFLERANFDLLFLGTNGVAVESGFTTPNEDEARMKELMAEKAARVIVVADGTKLGRRSFFRHARFTEVDAFVTDAVIEGELRDELKTAGIDVVDGVGTPRPEADS